MGPRRNGEPRESAKARASARASEPIVELAEMLEGPEPRPDMAFAETVHASEIPPVSVGDTAPPPSLPVLVKDPAAGTQWMTPLAFPVQDDEGTGSSRVAREALRLRRRALRLAERAREALTDARAVWSSWTWEKGDLVVGVAIGFGVFLVASVVGLQLAGGNATANASATPSLLDAPALHELDTTATPRVDPTRAKAARQR